MQGLTSHSRITQLALAPKLAGTLHYPWPSHWLVHIARLLQLRLGAHHANRRATNSRVMLQQTIIGSTRATVEGDADCAPSASLALSITRLALCHSVSATAFTQPMYCALSSTLEDISGSATGSLSKSACQRMASDLVHVVSGEDPDTTGSAASKRVETTSLRHMHCSEMVDGGADIVLALISKLYASNTSAPGFECLCCCLYVLPAPSPSGTDIRSVSCSPPSNVPAAAATATRFQPNAIERKLGC
ncbi:unnamed protein product [Phytophthora lilii]|uniref:Unnamed protein product n=1 Tax=Phytophthora lilii TaxID=2077276 RepID=A0A9W6TL29_9STRA|nr:unnamed protein product [Phytophthora lilii]